MRVTLRFRSREMAHQDIGVRALERVRSEIERFLKVEQNPETRSRPMVMMPSLR